jgi:hypothetical protein
MEPVVVARGDGPRVESLARGGGRSIRAAGRILGLFVLAAVVGARVPAAGQVSAGPRIAVDEKTPPTSILAERSSRPTGSPSGSTALAAGPSRGPDRPAPQIKGSLLPGIPTSPAPEDAKRFRIRDEWGDCVVARLHGQNGGKSVLVQPDGQLGFPSTLVPTDKPFVPMTAEELKDRLERGPYSGFQVLTTPHYLIFYQSKRPFAQKSARLLEDLYRGLIDFFHRHGMPIHEAEFPLVAVIFATEQDFRAHHPVDPEVQAYFQTFTNRIFFYEESERDRTEPKVMALRKPQTVAHEGAHQILANIGVQPRLSDWPLWLTEGFAEFCATPKWTKKGLTSWDTLGAINALHMVTLRELDDPLSNEPRDERARAKAPARPPRLVDSGSLVTKRVLTPTDYAQAWALTHYLTQSRAPDFVRYLKAMSQMPPLERRSPEQHLAEFRRFFGEPAKLDTKVEDYIRKQSQRRDFPDLPHYAVIFEQPLGGGMVHRKAMISQSPQVIQRWLEQSIPPQGGVYSWQVVPFPTRARAELAVEEWIRGY